MRLRAAVALFACLAAAGTLVLLASATTPPTPAAGATPVPPGSSPPPDQQRAADSPPETRVVFAIDNSGSMFDRGGSDPDEVRITGVRALIADLAALSGPDSPPLSIAALSFDNAEPHVLAPLRPADTPGLAASVQAIRGRGTDFRAALCAAWSLAAAGEPPPAAACPDVSIELRTHVQAARPPGPADRLIVVLVTDGSPAPDGDALPFDAEPAPERCPPADPTALPDAYATATAEAYLCALGDTWAQLRAERDVELIVIGLDATGEWFDNAQGHWRRVIQCGREGDDGPLCSERLVRAIDPDDLTDIIVSVFPIVDACAVGGCTVPPGLTRVRFSIAGARPGGSTSVTPPGGVAFASDTVPLPDGWSRAAAADRHVWSIDVPAAGVWAIDAETTGGREPRVLQEPTPARFTATVVRWHEGGLWLRLEIDPPADADRFRAAEAMIDGVYRARIDVGGRAVADAPLEYFEMDSAADEPAAWIARASGLAHPGGSPSLTVLLAPGDADPAPVARIAVLAPPPAPEDEEPTAEPQPMPTPEPCPDGSARSSDGECPSPAAPPECALTWDAEPQRWRFAINFASSFPLVRYREPAAWHVAVPADCPYVSVAASVADCPSCVAGAEGQPPLTLSVPLDGAGEGPLRGRALWLDPASGVEDVVFAAAPYASQPWLEIEPAISAGAHVIALLLAAAAAVVVAARAPIEWDPDRPRAAPATLAIPDSDGREVPILRWRLIIWRRAPNAPSGRMGPRLMRRWLVFGPLVARRPPDDHEPRRGRAFGTAVPHMGRGERVEIGIRLRSDRAAT